MRRLRSVLPPAAALACLAACAPVVTHGPRVAPGMDARLAVGWRASGCDSCGAGLVPPIGTILRYGWTPRGPEGPGYSVGAMVPGFVFIPAATLDLYAQAPARAGAAVVGGGVTVSALDVMPYVQAGRPDGGGEGWYTTQGIVLAAYRPEPEVFLDGGRGTVFEHVSAVYWSPTLAYQAEDVTVYASGALGSQDGGPEAGTGPRRPVRSLLVGLTMKVAIPFRPNGRAAFPRPSRERSLP